MVIGQVAVRCPLFPHLIVNRETALTFCSCNPEQANRLNRFASDCNPIPSAGWPFLVSEGKTVLQGELTRGSPHFIVAVSVAWRKARGAALRTERTVVLLKERGIIRCQEQIAKCCNSCCILDFPFQDHSANL